MSCPKCFEAFLLPGTAIGRIEEGFSGAYLSPGPTPSSNSSTDSDASRKAVVLLTDVYGLGIENPKIIADELAQRLKCDVWIPDYFAGRPIVRASDDGGPDRAGLKVTLLDWIKMFLFVIIPNLPSFYLNRPAVTDARLREFLAAIRDKKGYTTIGVVGYCFGGSTAIRFSGTDLIQTAVICHPGPFSLKEVEAIRVPTSWVCPEEDIFLSKHTRLRAEAILASRTDGYVYEFKDYAGTAHGFAARPNINLPEVKEAHRKALDQTVEWFQKMLIT